MTNFFDLHVNIEDLYNSANTNVDAIVKSKIAQGAFPINALEDGKNNSLVPVRRDSTSQKKSRLFNL